MKWLERNWRSLVFNLVILMIIAPIFLHLTKVHSSSELIASPNFKDAGKWAIRLLIISLSISPLVYLFNWRKLVPLRKWAGLWACAFAGLHLAYFLTDFTWRKIWGSDYANVGFAAFLILAVLALTSHHWAMRLLGRNWKRLHRLVYIAAILVVIHTVMVLPAWKRMASELSYVQQEFLLYGVIIGVLLSLRIPQVRNLVRSVLRLPKQKRKAKVEDLRQPA